MPELGKQIYGSGESGGQFIFTNLEELDSIIADLEAMRGEIVADDLHFRHAIVAALPPADDDMSQLQADMYRESLRRAHRHNTSLATYVADQLDKLQAARHAYVNADADAEDRVLDARRAGR
jgi:hypothetical protein